MDWGCGMKKESGSKGQLFEKFLTADKLQRLRVYDTLGGVVYEGLDVYMNDRKMPDRKRSKLLKHIRAGLSVHDGIASRKDWTKDAPAILIVPTEENQTGQWFDVLPGKEAKTQFSLSTGLGNISERERVSHPKDYRVLFGLLENRRILDMPVYERTGFRAHECLAAFFSEKKIKKPERKQVVSIVRDNLTEIIRYGEARREALKREVPALLADFVENSRVGTPIFHYTIMPHTEAKEVFSKDCRLI